MRFLLTVFVSVCCFAGVAVGQSQLQEKRYVQSLPKSSITASVSTISIKDPVDVTKYAEKSYSVLVKLVYGRENLTDTKSKTFSYALNYTLTYQNQTGQSYTPVQAGSELRLDYSSSASSNLEAYQNNPVPAGDWCGATLTVGAITRNINVPADVRLEVHLICNYRLTPQINLFAGSVQYNTTTKEISWPYQKGAAAYQVEWTYIDSAATYTPAPVTAAQFFAVKEPVRVMVKNQYYAFDPKYGSGKVYIRMRAVWIYGGAVESSQAHYSDWQYVASPVSIVNRTPAAGEIQAFEVKKNWQRTAQFAEDGKSSQAVSYYDGSLRSRQSIALMNSTQTEMVSEVLYDYEGRPVVNIMPYPVALTNLNYRLADNTFTGNTDPANKKVYDNTSGIYPKLDTIKGAANYYSSLNAFTMENKAYLPAAKGYAFSQIQYMQDGTGRVARQNLPGAAFVLTGKPGIESNYTSYFYDQAKPVELQRLFGNNVGNARHYEKRYVQDNNGQMTVSYVDQYGKVVATALAGNAATKNGTSTMLTIADNTAAQITVPLTEQNKFDAAQNAYISISSITNIIPNTTYTIDYDLTGALNNKATIAFPTCKACAYDLEIRVTGPDGLAVGSPIVRSNITASSVVCSDTVFTINNIVSDALVFSEIGEYRITKKLTLNQAAINTLYTAVQTSTKLPTYTSIQAQYRAEAITNNSSCDLTCRDRAVTANPTWDPISPTYDGLNHDTDIATWTAANCNADAPIDSVKTDPCESILAQINDELASLGYTLPTQHPEYCHYLACVREAKSRVYDMKMAQVKNWTSAVALGYHNPLAMMEGDVYSTATGGRDTFLISAPFAAAGVYKDSLDVMKNRMKVFYKESSTGFDLNFNGNTSDTYSLWTYCSQPGVYGSTNATWNALTAAQKDAQQWQTFLAVYSGLKQRLIHNLKVSTAATAWYCPYRNEEYAIVPEPFLSTDVAEINNKIYDNQNKDCDYVCNLNADLWMRVLRDSGCTSWSPTDSNSVRTYLKAYCSKKCGLNNPLGILDAADLAIVATGNMTVINATPGLPELKKAYDILNAKPNCGLSKASYSNVYNYGSSIILSNSQAITVSSFAYSLATATNALLAEARSKSNSIINCPDTSSNLFLNQAYSMNFGSSGYYYQYNTLMPDPVLGTSTSSRYISFVNDEATKLGATVFPATDIALKPYIFTAFAFQGPYAKLYPCYGTCKYATNDPGINNTQLEATYYFVSYAGGIYTKVAKSTIYSINNPRYKSMPVYNYLLYDGTSNAYTKTTNFIAYDAILLDINGNKYNNTIYIPDFGSNTPHPGYSFIESSCISTPSSWYLYTVPVFKTAFPITVTPVTGLQTCTGPPTQPATGAKVLCGSTVSFNRDTLRKQCRAELIRTADSLAMYKYRDTIQQLTTAFMTQQFATCFAAKVKENFTLTYSNQEYYYTLYYYDQAGNLTMTVPPEGVYPLVASNFTNGYNGANPAHKLQTYYRYNSAGQLVYQQNPDGGVANFFYDSKGELRLSQNAKQRAVASGNVFSYSKYDNQGRIIEVGEVQNLPDPVTYYTNPTNRKTVLARLDDRSFPTATTSPAYTPAFKDVVQTIYDAGGSDQQNLRSRVATVITRDSAGILNTRSRYSYDIHGNVKTLYQEPVAGQQKTIQYTYDLISGIVKRMDYQKGTAEQYAVKYSYDLDNRLRGAYSSRDNGLTWQQDAEYQYYLHGPLARTEYGNNKVQGMDYAYTLQGWMKLGNTTHSRTLASGVVYKNTLDIGNDGIGTGLNRYVAQDEFAFALGYYQNDYAAVSSAANTGLSATAASGMSTKIKGAGLYNGNITWQISQLNRFSEMNNSIKDTSVRAAAYQYDQLNRLMAANNFLLNTGNNLAAVTNRWESNYTYDRNGNIKTAAVAGNGSQMDNLTYNYTVKSGRLSVHNRLNSVTESLTNNSAYSTDIDNGQAADNYRYDEIGNLIADDSEQLTKITWTANGKVRRVTKTGKKIEYVYDGTGNRVVKKVTAGSVVTETRYMRDATGNVIATNTTTSADDSVRIDYSIYGSSRLGTLSQNKKYKNADAVALAAARAVYKLQPGTYQYELSNHLGNVQAVITGHKQGQDLNGDSIVDYYRAGIVSLTDYYPFGMVMPGRSYTNLASEYRYGFNGKEKDPDMDGGACYDYGFRIYNPRLGKFLSVDPLTKDYPSWSPYPFAMNRPIDGIDLDGLEWIGTTDGSKPIVTPVVKVVQTPKPIAGAGLVTATQRSIAANANPTKAPWSTTGTYVPQNSTQLKPTGKVFTNLPAKTAEEKIEEILPLLNSTSDFLGDAGDNLMVLGGGISAVSITADNPISTGFGISGGATIFAVGGVVSTVGDVVGFTSTALELYVAPSIGFVEKNFPILIGKTAGWIAEKAKATNEVVEMVETTVENGTKYIVDELSPNNAVPIQ